MSNTLRSPLPWIGGKFHLAKRILSTFPPAEAYDTYVEPFGGAAHVLSQKPRGKHVEVYNDTNNLLVNFWMCLRNYPDELITRLESLPYARALYYDYHKSLFDGTTLTPIERAERWYYVLRSSFRASVECSPNGWLHTYTRGHAQPGPAHAYREVLGLFQALAKRFEYVQIDCCDFEPLLRNECNNSRSLFYVDPPYFGVEDYYGSFTQADHERLAQALNETSAYVALSYYPTPQLEELYPENKWRRVTWQIPKRSQRTKESHDLATELLLCNYPAPTQSLWDLPTEGGDAA